MVRAGEARLLMKGALHADELLRAVMHVYTGLRTGRGLSDIYLLDVPDYARPLLLIDAAGIVLGATVPVILTSRADTFRTCLASCAAAAILAASGLTTPPATVSLCSIR